ncbi:MAG: hypothetical protein ABI608_07980, partial [Rhizomicrobium sp.]
MKRRTLLGAVLPLLTLPSKLANAADRPAAPNSAAGKGMTGSVAMHNGRATLFIDGKPVYPMLYALTDTPGGRWTWEEICRENLENFTQANVSLVQVDIWLEYIWSRDGRLDMDLVRRQIRGVLDVNPNAAVSIRLHVNAPPWWNADNPGELTQYADGPVVDIPLRGLQRPLENDLERVPRASMASLKWRTEAGEKTKEFCRRLCTMPEGLSVYGIHPACGVFHEWHYWGFIKYDPDTGSCMTRYFRQWLTEKYGNDAALQAAWNQPSAQLASAAVPSTPQRRAISDGLFRDPQRERQVSDYFECQHLTVADSIIHFCRVAKESWNRQLVTGVFYGYFFVLFGRPQTGGHLQLQRILNSPWVDYLSAPQAYSRQFRGLNGSGQARGLPESLRLHGKLLLDEMDQEPASYRKEGAEAPVLLADSVAILRRNVAQTYTQGHGLWFYDFGPGRGNKGWWDDAVLMKDIAAMRDLFGRYYQKPYRPQADVALVYDTDSFYFSAAYADQDPVISPVLVDGLPPHLYRSGAAIDIFHVGDLERAQWERYKAVVFANTFLLTPSQKNFIRRTVAANGRHLFWIMAPGYTDGLRNDVRWIGETTGMNIVRHDLGGPPRATARFSGQTRPLQVAKAFSPFFVVEDRAAMPLGTLDGSGAVILARRNRPTHTSWYCSMPPTDDDLLGYVFKEAGAHIYMPPGDVIHAGGGIICLHTLQGGKRELLLKNGKRVSVQLPPRSTSLYDAETG